jgi:ribonuclease E
MRAIEEIALRERQGEVQLQVPIEIAAFLLNEKRDSLIYLEQSSRCRITILPHPHLETPHYHISFNREGNAPASYDLIERTQELGYATDWQQPQAAGAPARQASARSTPNSAAPAAVAPQAQAPQPVVAQPAAQFAWLENLFTPRQARPQGATTSNDAASAIEQLVNGGAVSRGIYGEVAVPSDRRPASTEPSINAYASGVLPATASAQPTPSGSGQKRDRNNRNRRGRENTNSTESNTTDNSQFAAPVIDTAPFAEEAPVPRQNRSRRNNQNDAVVGERDQRDTNTMGAVSTEEGSNAAPVRRDRNSNRNSRGPRQRDTSVLETQSTSASEIPAFDSGYQPAVSQDTADPLATRVIANPADSNPSNLVVFGLDEGTETTVTALQSDVVEVATPVTAAPEQPETGLEDAPVVTGELPRAGNDPRERRRRRELGLDQPAPAVVEAVTVEPITPSTRYEPVTVQGSVGDFVRATLGAEGEALLAEGRVVEAFLTALKGRPVVAEVAPIAVPQVDAEPADVVLDAPVVATEAASLPPMTTDVIAPPVADRPRAANDPRMRRRLAAEAKLAASAEPVVLSEIPLDDLMPPETVKVTAEQVVSEEVRPSGNTSGLEVSLIAPEVQSTTAAEVIDVASVVSHEEPTPEVQALTEQEGVEDDEHLEGADEEPHADDHEPESANLDSRGRPRRPRVGGRPPKKRAPVIE